MIHHRRYQAHTALGLATAVLMLLTACGRRATTDGSTTPAAPTTTATTTTAPTPTTSPTTTSTAITPTSTATTADPASVKATITANWERFFLATTPIPDRIALLENGPTLQQAMEQRAQDPLMQQASAVVKAVELTAPDRATVTYDVLLNGVVALPDGQGIAVLQDGVWKVSGDSFCALISLGATGPIPGCS